MSYNILTIDGGGLRGLISTILLQRIEEKKPGFLQSIDLVVGTSTGGILALAIAAGISLERIATLYETRGATIFDDSLWDDVRDLGKTIGADYDNKNLKKELGHIFGNATLTNLSKKVAITAFDLDYVDTKKNPPQRTWKPKIFHNFLAGDGGLRAADVALYTSSAPTYFPSADGYVDGGVFASNPSMVGLAQALDSRNGPNFTQELANIKLLSLGTGTSLSFIEGDRIDWGYSQWVKPLISILMDGVAGIADFQCKQILGSRYHRLQTVFANNETISLDSVAKLPRMRQIAEVENIGDTLSWLKANNWR